MASRAAHSARAYRARQTRGVGILSELLYIPRKTTAIIGGGAKTTLLRALAEELAAEGAAAEGASGEKQVQRARVIVATSTKMFVPDWCPVLLDATIGKVRAALSTHSIICVGRIHEPSGKLDAPRLAFSDLEEIADYVLVEADGAKMLPLKAHAEHEPVIPECAKRTVCVVGIDGVGKPISQACHRPERFAQLAGASTADAVTPEMVARVLQAESLHDIVLINKVESSDDWRVAERIASLSTTSVVAGSLWRKEFRCLR